jgi:hypothetical protein
MCDETKELENLREFARAMLSKKTCGFISSESIWHQAIKHGIVNSKIVLEPCGPSCACAERFSDHEFDQGVLCYDYKK